MSRSDSVEGLHAEVDAAAQRLVRLHRERLRCGAGCADCCVDGITVFEVEAERIRRAHRGLLDRERPHPPGACALLDADDRTCRIYPDRPYVCRTQGLPLRWIDDGDGPDGEPVERRDICPLNEGGGAPLLELDEAACWTLGPFEGRLARLQVERGGGPTRVALRSLFRRGGEAT